MEVRADESKCDQKEETAETIWREQVTKTSG